jgi:hypothetical protein
VVLTNSLRRLMRARDLLAGFAQGITRDNIAKVRINRSKTRGRSSSACNSGYSELKNVQRCCSAAAVAD